MNESFKKFLSSDRPNGAFGISGKAQRTGTS
jgi:hypothetical protein